MVSSDSLKYICPAKISERLTKKIQEIAVQVYKCVECRDLGRVDFRVDEQGNTYVLEINPLPSLERLDVFNIFPQQLGSSYNDVINYIVDLALERYGLADQPASLRIATHVKDFEEAQR
jgi:D-alanine-D-alanine ligase